MIKSVSGRGKLFLFPVTIGTEEIEQCLPSYNKECLNSCNTFIVEVTRTARRFLKKAGYIHSIDATVFHELNKHTNDSEIASFLTDIESGKNVGLLSEAGTPCIADPGALIVALAQEKGIEVIPLVGPSSLLLSLMASGFNGQNFAFVGYLPIEKNARAKKIKDLENRIYREKQTQIFIETPYRNNELLKALINLCTPQTKLCVACNIHTEDQYIKTKTIALWKNTSIDLHKKNTVFILYC